MVEEIIIQIGLLVLGLATGFIIAYLTKPSGNDVIEKIYKIAQTERMMQATRLGIVTEAKAEKDIAK